MYKNVLAVSCILLLVGCQGRFQPIDKEVVGEAVEKQTEKEISVKSDEIEVELEKDKSRENCYKGHQGTPVGVCSIEYDSKKVLEEGEYIYTLPYEVGTSHVATQGYNSVITHFGQSAYSIDWMMDEGTPVLAAREGIVKEVVDNFDEGAPDPSYANKVNYVAVQHDDGTIAWYGHAMYKSAKVKVGDKVEVGQVLNLAGCTGDCSVPHLHFQVMKKDGVTTIPTVFKIGYGEMGKIVEEVLYEAPGDELSIDPTAVYPEDSLARLPHRLGKLIAGIEDKEEASKVFRDYMKDNLPKLKQQWKDLTNRAMNLDRNAQRELEVIMNECLDCMNINFNHELARIFDPDLEKVFYELTADMEMPAMPEDAQEGLQIYWQVFSY